MIPEEIGRDSKSVTELQRKHTAFERELQALGLQVHAVQQDAALLLPAYADAREKLIRDKRDEVLNAWRNLQRLCDARRGRLMDTFDLYRFLNMVRELMAWIDSVLKEMAAQERPKYAFFLLRVFLCLNDRVVCTCADAVHWQMQK